MRNILAIAFVIVLTGCDWNDDDGTPFDDGSQKPANTRTNNIDSNILLSINNSDFERSGDTEIDSDDWTWTKVSYRLLGVGTRSASVAITYEAREGNRDKSFGDTKFLVKRTIALRNYSGRIEGFNVARSDSFIKWYRGERHYYQKFPDFGPFKDLYVSFDRKGRSDHEVMRLKARVRTAVSYEFNAYDDFFGASKEDDISALVIDFEGRRIPDFQEPIMAIALTTDSDGDGILDTNESSGDTDRDGVPDYLDIDSDNDGLLDSAEAGGFTEPLDTDGDGIADFVDLDSDNDGLTDTLEAGGDDIDGDGIVDNFIDANGDGQDDGVGLVILSFDDTDKDGIFDHLDLDSDNDGLSDVFESSTFTADKDGDGVLDNVVDVDGNGLADNIIPNRIIDSDGDGIPNHIELDSDDDNVLDIVEAGYVDSDDDGQVDSWSDADNDGISDKVDVDSVGGEDKDNDGIADFADTDFHSGEDADGDGIVDSIDDDPFGTGFIPLSVGY